jgi:integrase
VQELARIFQQVGEQQASNSTVLLGHALGKWLRTAELEGTTRKSYSSYIERTIKPAPGEIVLPKVDAPTFGILYTEVQVGAG